MEKQSEKTPLIDEKPILIDINEHLKNRGEKLVHEDVIQEYTPSTKELIQTIENPLQDNPQLVATLEQANFTVGPEDRIIRKGRNLILRKRMQGSNPDGSSKYFDTHIPLSKETQAEVEVEFPMLAMEKKLQEPVKQEKIPPAVKTTEKPFVESVTIDGHDVYRGQVIKTAPYYEIVDFEKKGDQEDILLFNKEKNELLRIPVNTFYEIHTPDDIEMLATKEIYDPKEERYLKIMKEAVNADVEHGTKEQQMKERELADLDKEIEKNKKFLEEMFPEEISETIIPPATALKKDSEAMTTANEHVRLITKSSEQLEKELERFKGNPEYIKNIQARIEQNNKDIVAWEESKKTNAPVKAILSTIQPAKTTEIKKEDIATAREKITEAEKIGNEEAVLKLEDELRSKEITKKIQENAEDASKILDTKLDAFGNILENQQKTLEEKYGVKKKTSVQLVTDARDAYLKLYADSFEKKGAFKRGILNLGHATGFMKKDSEKFLNDEAKEAKKKYDELKNGLEQGRVDRLKASGKSDEEVIAVMLRYRKITKALDLLEQESEILKSARDKAFTASKFEKGTKKILNWYAKIDPLKKKAIGITAAALIGTATGGISSAATAVGFLGARIARMYVGTGTGWLASWAGEKIWKSGAGGKYEIKLEELKKQYMSGEITPAKYQQTKEGLEMMENRAKTIKTAATMGAAFGAAAETGSVIHNAIDTTPQYHPTNTPSGGFDINLQDYKVNTPPEQFITEPSAPTEIPSAIDHAPVTPVTTPEIPHTIETIHNDTGPLQLDTETFRQQIKDTQVKINLGDNAPIVQPVDSDTGDLGKIDFNAPENQYDNRVIVNPELHDAAAIETLANQEYNRMITNNFASENNPLWNNAVKNTDASQFINANPADLKDEYLKLQVDLKTLSGHFNIAPPEKETLEGYMKILSHKLAEEAARK